MTSITQVDDPAWKQIEDIVNHTLEHPIMWANTSEGLETSLAAYIDCWCMIRYPKGSRALYKKLGQLRKRERSALKLGARRFFCNARIANAQSRDGVNKIVIGTYRKIWFELREAIPALIQLAEVAQ